MKPEAESDTKMSALSLDREEAGECFRVKVCMERYFSDERARAYVCVRRARPVRWLGRRLRALFALPPRFVLLSAGHLLPPDEPLAVLAPDDTVDVVPSCVNVGADGYWSEVDENVAASPGRVSTDSPNIGAARPKEMLDLVDGGDDAQLPSTGAVLQLEEDEELKERKRRALLILQQYGDGGGGEPSDDSGVTRPRRRRLRRRVRRRRLEPAGAGSPAGPSPDRAASDPDKVAPNGEPLQAMGVLRNGRERSRQPRVIRPLADTEL